MYVGGAKGFLHWGYNYYYGALSHGLFNPMINPCGYKQLAGASYIVYPDITGEPIPSLRMKVFYEAINDYGALQLLESLIGKVAVLKFIETTVGKVNYKYSPTNQELFEFRQKLNNEISKNIYKALRKADNLGVDLVIIEGVEKRGLGLAIMNRLLRACEYNII